MDSKALRSLAMPAAAIGFLLATACSTGPQPPKVGTPAYYWAAAKETYGAGDYQRTAEHLENLARSENEFTERAQPWHLVLTAGTARGHMDIADHFEYGAKARRGAATPFLRAMNQHRSLASRTALRFAEIFETFEKLHKAQKVALDFSFPGGSPLEDPMLKRIGGGYQATQKQLDDLQRQHIQTMVLKITCRAAGAEDTAKIGDLFKTGKVEIDKGVFVFEMANQLHELSQLFGRAKLDEPQRQEFFANHSMEALKTVPESKQTKDLAAKLEKTMKLFKTKK